MADLILLNNATNRFLTRINIAAVLDTKWAHTKNTHFSQERPCRRLSLRILHKDLNSIAFFIPAGEQTATVVFDGVRPRVWPTRGAQQERGVQPSPSKMGWKWRLREMHSLPTQRTRSGSLPYYSTIYHKVAVARCKLRVMQMFLSSKQLSTLP